MVESEGEPEMEPELSLDEFITLLRFVNAKLEVLLKEAARFQKLSRRTSTYGVDQDWLKLLLAGTGRASAPPRAEEEELLEDEEVKRRAKEIARRLREREGKE